MPRRHPYDQHYRWRPSLTDAAVFAAVVFDGGSAYLLCGWAGMFIALYTPFVIVCAIFAAEA